MGKGKVVCEGVGNEDRGKGGERIWRGGGGEEKVVRVRGSEEGKRVEGEATTISEE